MKRQQILTSVLVLGLLLALAVGISVRLSAHAEALAQGPGPNQPQSETEVAETLEDRIPIQGQLTDAGGTPLDGSYDVTMRLYDVELEGTALCTDTHTVDVDNGLFSTYLEGCATHVDGRQQLYLGIKVGSDGEMTPRQPIYPVPYAYSLRPGAEIRGSSSATPTLFVHNSAGAGIQGSGNLGVQGIGGVWGVSGQAAGFFGYGVGGEALLPTIDNQTHGVYGVTRSNYPASAGVFGEATAAGMGVYAKSQSGTALYANSQSGTAISAGGTGIIRSSADTEIAVSPLKIVASYNSNVELRSDGAYMEVRPNASGFQYVHVPVDLPSVLFGTTTKLKSVRICYRCDQAGSFVATTIVAQGTDSGSFSHFINNMTDRTSTSWECYTVTAATPEEITGSLWIALSLDFAGTGASHDIRVGNITLTLTEE